MKRDTSIDIARGIGMLLIVLGHIPSIPFEVKKVIYSFHIPLFFFISGFLYNYRKYNGTPFKTFFVKKLKRLIIPYFIMGFICFLLFGIIYPLITQGLNKDFIIGAIKYFIGLIYSAGSPNWLAWSSPLWFLTCSFVSELILFAVLKYAKKHFLIFFCIGIFGYAYTLFLGFKIPWNIDIALTASCFMYIGNIFRNYNLIDKLNKPQYVTMLLIIFTFSVLFNSSIDLNLRDLGNIVFTYLSGVSGSVLTILISKKINSSLLSYYGNNSLLMMGFTYAILNIVLVIGEKVTVLNNMFISFLVQVILLTILIYAKNKVLLKNN